MNMKLAVAFAVLLIASTARADSNLEVSVPDTYLPFGGDTVSLTFDWDTTNNTLYNFDFILDGSQQLVAETSSLGDSPTFDPATNGLVDLAGY
jgi:hypothetical protein